LFGPNGKPLAAATRPSPDVDVLVEWMGNFYPPAAIRERREGDVTVSMCIGPDGKARNVRLVRSSGSPDLDNATLNGLPSMRFHPACDAKGHPVDWCEPPYPLTVSWQMSSQ
jgi:protein TonB